MPKEKFEEVRKLMEEDPEKYEQMLNKKKWNTIHKNPTKALKEQLQNNQYWNLLNNMPPEHVDGIVTEKILNMDKQSCDNLLKTILVEKAKEDEKQDIRR